MAKQRPAWIAEVAREKSRLGLNNKDIAEMTKFSESYIRQLLSGAKKGSDAAEKICRKLNIKYVSEEESA